MCHADSNGSSKTLVCPSQFIIFACQRSALCITYQMYDNHQGWCSDYVLFSCTILILYVSHVHINKIKYNAHIDRQTDTFKSKRTAYVFQLNFYITVDHLSSFQLPGSRHLNTLHSLWRLSDCEKEKRCTETNRKKSGKQEPWAHTR